MREWVRDGRRAHSLSTWIIESYRRQEKIWCIWGNFLSKMIFWKVDPVCLHGPVSPISCGFVVPSVASLQLGAIHLLYVRPAPDCCLPATEGNYLEQQDDLTSKENRRLSSSVKPGRRAVEGGEITRLHSGCLLWDAFCQLKDAEEPLRRSCLSLKSHGNFSASEWDEAENR